MYSVIVSVMELHVQVYVCVPVVPQPPASPCTENTLFFPSYNEKNKSIPQECHTVSSSIPS